MSKLDKLEVSIMAVMYKAAGPLDAFSIYRRTKVSLSSFTSTMLKLQQKHFVLENEGKLQLTQTGREAISLQKQEVKDKEWRKVPNFFQRPSLSTEEFYIPRRSLLDKNTFKSLEDNLD